MIKPEEVMNIRFLAKCGCSMREIARKAGIDRRTVKKYLKEGVIPEYRGQKRTSQLIPYRSLIQGWLKQDDYQASRIHEMLTMQGFAGSYDIVQRYVKTLKEERDRVAYVRFETMPGRQAQVDFGDFQVVEPDGTIKTVYCFIMSLGYSRHKYVEFIDKCTMTNFLACHQHAFAFFGGIPAEILYDNMKNVVIKRLVGVVEWNKTFTGFAMHYGFKPLAAPAYSPWVKGKVERPMKYIRERFWRGYVFGDFIQANQDIRRWIMTTAFERTHGTTREKVSDRFTREKPYLGNLPAHAYDVSEKAFRKVHKDCQLSFDGNRYVVPHECVGKNVLLRIRDSVIRIFDDDRMIAVYRIPEGKGKTLAHPRFYQRLRRDQEQLRKKYRKPWGKAKATRGLLKNGLRVEVMKRALSVYDEEVIR
jgi:transposase